MFDGLTELINYFTELMNEAASGSPDILTFLLILIVSGTLAEIFMKFIKNRFLGLLVASVSSMWLFNLVYIQRLPFLSILISMVILVALLVIFCLVIAAVFLKRLPVIFKIPKV